MSPIFRRPPPPPGRFPFSAARRAPPSSQGVLKHVIGSNCLWLQRCSVPERYSEKFSEALSLRGPANVRRRARERAKEPIARAMALEHGGQVRRTCKKKMAGHCRQDGFRLAIRRKTLGTKYDACHAWPGQVSVERAVEGWGRSKSRSQFTLVWHRRSYKPCCGCRHFTAGGWSMKWNTGRQKCGISSAKSVSRVSCVRKGKRSCTSRITKQGKNH